MRFLLIFGLLLNLAVADEGARLVELINAQNTFYLFPWENNGEFSYQKAASRDCDIMFRDSLGLKGSNESFTYYESTKVTNFSLMQTVQLTAEENADYWKVSFGASNGFFVRVYESVVRDESGERSLDNDALMSSQMRFDSEERAQEAYALIKKLIARCQ